MRYAIEPLRKEGIRIVYYLDDICIPAKTKQEMNQIDDQRVYGFCIQQQYNADICTTIEDYQPDEDNSTVAYFSEENVQMDRRPTREDDFHDSSSGRGSITDKIPTTGPVEDITPDETELGSNLQIVKHQPSRVTLVGNFHNTEERPPNPKDSNRKPEYDHPCRYIKQWMGNQLGTDHSFRILEPGREISFNKCTRAEANFICDSAPCWKMGNNINDLAGPSNSNTRIMQPAQHQGNISTHSRGDGHSGRQIELTEETAIRINEFEKDVQLYTEKMGEAEDRRLCSAPQPPAAKALDIVNRPSSFSRRCPATSMITEGDVFISTLETDTPSTEKTSRTKGKASSSSDSIVAQPILVPDDPKDETPTTNNHLENKSEMVSSRLAIINNSRLQDGLDEETDNKEYSSIHLNTLRSSIASVFSIIHSQKQPIAGQPLIKDFFTTKRNSEVKIPSEQQLTTWDVNIFVKYIKKELSPTSGLSLVQLQLKTILLLCIATMWRPRSDIDRLQYHDVILKQDETTTSILTNARTPKEGQHPTSVRPTTVANWIKAAMDKAGVDTNNYQAHSIRAASSTKAVELDHSIKDVKKYAKWSLNSNTFEQYNYKPSSQSSFSIAISNSLFSCPEKRITSEVEVESTGIRLDTTTNTNIDETKTEDVIHTRAWYCFF
ncbi:hypothetical protein G6F46_004388 [Rhizopus delemar]|nr:hypothetical protein G6F46_004388 [Rhizopus delemar]